MRSFFRSTLDSIGRMAFQCRPTQVLPSARIRIRAYRRRSQWLWSVFPAAGDGPPGTRAMHHDGPLKYGLVPTAVMEGHMNGHDVGGPRLAEGITRDASAVEAPEWTHEPDVVLEQHGWWFAGECNPLWPVFGVHIRECTSIDLSVRSYSFTQVGGCLLWPHGMG